MKYKSIIKALLIYFTTYFFFQFIPVYTIFENNEEVIDIYNGFMGILFYGNNILIIALLYFAYKVLSREKLPDFLQQPVSEMQPETREQSSRQAPSEHRKRPLKYLFIIFIALLCLSGFLGISALVGSMGSGSWENMKILLTTLITDFYLLMSLAHIRHINIKERFLNPFSKISLAINILGLLFSLLVIWEVSLFSDGEPGKFFLIFMIISFCLAHMALLFSIKPRHSSVKLLLMTSVIFIIINAIYAMKIVANINNNEEHSLTILAILSILVVLGSLITPLLNRMKEIQDNQKP
ncbi:MAG: hypothetical protein JXR70_04880 [Spirochaetales bacterium]|nr:hypothetical protein [Spirochaetales bacterium]